MRARLWRKLLRLLPWLGLGLVLLINLRLLLGVSELHDLGSFLAAGRAAGAGENPFAVYPASARGEFQGQEYSFPNLNPPVWLFLFEALARFGPGQARLAWLLLSLGLYAAGLALLYRQHRPAPIWLAWALCLAGLWNTLMLGQVYALPFLLAAGAWAALPRGRPVLAGILIGCAAALKPNLLFWPLLLFLSGERKSALWALGAFGLAGLLPLAFFGAQVYSQWLEAALAADWLTLPHYLSLFSLSARLGLAWLGLPLALGLLGGLAWWAWRRRPGVELAGAVALAGAILASPLATPRFTLLLVPAFFAFSGQPRLRLPAAVLVLPVAVLIWLASGPAPLAWLAGWIYPLALFYFLWVLLKEQ